MDELHKNFDAITWEHMLFLFSIVFILVFRKPISILIPKIRTISKDGITTDTSPETQLEKSNSEAVQQLLDVVQNTIVISDLEDRIKNDLKTKGLIATDDASKILIRHLAGTQLLLNFEQIHQLIFGSQIFLLKKLNEVAGQGRHIEYLIGYVESVKKLYADTLTDWSKDKYLAFLFSRHLIIQHGEQVHITNLGVEYLVWIARSGKRDDNAL